MMVLAPIVIRCLPVSTAVSAMTAVDDMAVSGLRAVGAGAGRRDMRSRAARSSSEGCESLKA